MSGVVCVEFLIESLPLQQQARSSKLMLDLDHLFQLVDDMHSMWEADPFLDRAQELVKKAIDEHTEYDTAELDRSRPVKKKR